MAIAATIAFRYLDPTAPRLRPGVYRAQFRREWMRYLKPIGVQLVEYLREQCELSIDPTYQLPLSLEAIAFDMNICVRTLKRAMADQGLRFFLQAQRAVGAGNRSHWTLTVALDNPLAPHQCVSKHRALSYLPTRPATTSTDRQDTVIVDKSVPGHATALAIVDNSPMDDREDNWPAQVPAALKPRYPHKAVVSSRSDHDQPSLRVIFESKSDHDPLLQQEVDKPVSGTPLQLKLWEIFRLLSLNSLGQVEERQVVKILAQRFTAAGVTDDERVSAVTKVAFKATLNRIKETDKAPVRNPGGYLAYIAGDVLQRPGEYRGQVAEFDRLAI